MLLTQLLFALLNLLHHCYAPLLQLSELFQLSVRFGDEDVPALFLAFAIWWQKVGEEIVIVVNLEFFDWLFYLFIRLRCV